MTASDPTPLTAEELAELRQQHRFSMDHPKQRCVICRLLATLDARELDVERLARALPCEDPEEPCDADGRDEHRWCDYCIARSVIRRPSFAAEIRRPDGDEP